MRLCAFFWMLAVLCRAGDAAAQTPAALEEGVRYWEAGDHAQAEARFRAVYEADSAYLSPERGTAAYWLGQALLHRGADDQAFAVWWRGLQALAGKGVVDLPLADTFVREVYARQRRRDYAAAADVYVWILRSLDAALTEAQRTSLKHHLEPLAWILPEEMLERTGLRPLAVRRKQEVAVTTTAGAGETLARWWRSQDVLPATSANERLQEHLQRVAYAWAHYQTDGIPDDRARIYVRLGAPYKKTKVRFNGQEFLNKVVFRQLTLSSFDFPENEFWVYSHIDHAAYYLFVADLDWYWLGEPNDLLPAQLQGGLTNSERGIRQAEALVRTMEEIYKELALFHDDFALRYQDASDFAEQFDVQDLHSQAEIDQEVLRQGGELQDVPRDLSGSRPTTPVRTDLLSQLPHSFAMSMIARADYEDGLAAQQREEAVPPSYTTLFHDAEALPVVVRTARFLDDDGTTRTELFWGLPPGGLTPSRRTADALREAGISLPEPYLLLVTALQQDEDLFEQARHLNRHLIGKLAAADDRAVLEPQQYVIPGGEGTYHLAVQWDQHVAVLDAAQHTVAGLGPLVKRGVVRIDSLRALDARPEVLEMSDLKPVLLPLDQGEVVFDGEETPYPFVQLAGDIPLALYFETYHLAFGPDDRTHYTVEYEVLRRDEGGGLISLIRGDGEERTAARTSFTGSSRTAREHLLIDWEEWTRRGVEGDIEITLRITDEVTGRQAERTITFTRST